MTVTSFDRDEDPPKAVPTTVKAIDGFFVPKSSIDGDETTPSSLFQNYKLADESWGEFLHKLSQLDKEQDTPRFVKVVYFLRHAEGTHNEAHAKYGSPKWEDELARTEAFLDAPLTPFGVKDAQSKGPSSVSAELEKGMHPIERVVVSPISRAIQTAQNFFTQDQVPDEPFVCIESVRETFDCHTCNKRRPLSDLKNKFPHVDFSRMKDEEDLMWSPTHKETKEEIQERARGFLIELFREVPERYVVVAAHLSIIEAICAVATGSATRVLPKNCEVVPMVLEAMKA